MNESARRTLMRVGLLTLLAGLVLVPVALAHPGHLRGAVELQTADRDDDGPGRHGDRDDADDDDDGDRGDRGRGRHRGRGRARGRDDDRRERRRRSARRYIADPALEECRKERGEIGSDDFRDRYLRNDRGRNRDRRALHRCVQRRLRAAFRECGEERRDDPDDFRDEFDDDDRRPPILECVRERADD